MELNSRLISINKQQRALKGVMDAVSSTASHSSIHFHPGLLCTPI